MKRRRGANPMGRLPGSIPLIIIRLGLPAGHFDRIEGFGLREVGVVGRADLGRQDDERQTDDQVPRRKPCTGKPHGPALRGPGRSVHCSIAISLSWISVPEQFSEPGGTSIASYEIT